MTDSERLSRHTWSEQGVGSSSQTAGWTRVMRVRTNDSEAVSVPVEPHESPAEVRARLQAQEEAVEPSGTDDDTAVGLGLTAAGHAYSGRTLLVPSDEEVTVWVGVADESQEPPEGLSDEEVDITVTRPDGGTDEETVTTGDDGNATYTYDLSGRDDGIYDVLVEHGGESNAGEFIAGPDVASMDGFTMYAPVNEEATATFLAREGDSPASNLELTLRVTSWALDEPIEETHTTDEDGFVSISFTPEETDNYTVEVEDDDDEVVASTNVRAFEYLVANNFPLSQALRETESVFGGYLCDADGHAPNETFELEFYESATDDDPFFETEVTTDDGGFFAVEHEVPEDVSTIVASPEAIKDGEEVPVQSSLSIDDPPDPDDPDPDPEPDPVTLSASLDKIFYAPGETVVLDVEAQDDDGTPLDGEDVMVYAQYGFDGPPAYSETVTTDDDGTASVSFDLPPDAPDDVRLEATAVVEYEDDVYTTSSSSRIIFYDPFLNFSLADPGEEMEVEAEAWDSDFDGVADVPQQAAGVYDIAWDGTFDTGGMVTDDDGRDTAVLDVPDDIQYFVDVIDMSRYWDESSSLGTSVSYPGDLSAPDTVEPGETVTLSFDPGDGSTVSGIGFTDTSRPVRQTLGGLLDEDDEVTFEIPDYVDDGTDLLLEVWAVNDEGELYSDVHVATVEDDVPLDVTAFDTEIETGQDATFSLDAQGVSTLTIEKLWTDWEFESAELDGGDGSKLIEDEGKYTIEWDETQDSVSPSLTVSVPFDPPETGYVGGEYRLDVTAADGTDAVSDTMTLEISESD